MAIFNSYVSLPVGILTTLTLAHPEIGQRPGLGLHDQDR